MIVEQPIDKIIEKSGCKYVLVKGVSLRARNIVKELNAKNLEGENKPLTLASREYWNGYYDILQKKVD